MQAAIEIEGQSYMPSISSSQQRLYDRRVKQSPPTELQPCAQVPERPSRVIW
jgi:hypothetical protein